jgi:hypothetical protein
MTNGISPDSSTEDPWDWDVNRVIQELSTRKPSCQSLLTSRIEPNPELFEALRDHEVSGSVLLMDVDDNEMEKSLRLELRQREFLHNVIGELRLRSPQYRAYRKKHPSYPKEFYSHGSLYYRVRRPISKD